MADLIVTFRRDQLPGLTDIQPLARGRDCFTEVVAIGGASAPTAHAATAGECYIEIYAGAACWCLIAESGSAAVITAGNTGASFFMAEGDRITFYARSGDKVAVIGA